MITQPPTAVDVIGRSYKGRASHSQRVEQWPPRIASRTGRGALRRLVGHVARGASAAKAWIYEARRQLSPAYRQTSGSFTAEAYAPRVSCITERARAKSASTWRKEP